MTHAYTIRPWAPSDRMSVFRHLLMPGGPAVESKIVAEGTPEAMEAALRLLSGGCVDGR